MIKLTKLTIIFSLLTSIGFSQSDTVSNNISSDVFDKIAKSVKDFHVDTTAAPDDKITRKIIELKNLRGGFNINEAVDFKIEEDRQKNEVPKAELEKFAIFFKSGDGKR
jgi:hypothetical protein